MYDVRRGNLNMNVCPGPNVLSLKDPCTWICTNRHTQPRSPVCSRPWSCGQGRCWCWFPEIHRGRFHQPEGKWIEFVTELGGGELFQNNIRVHFGFISNFRCQGDAAPRLAMEITFYQKTQDWFQEIFPAAFSNLKVAWFFKEKINAVLSAAVMYKLFTSNTVSGQLIPLFLDISRVYFHLLQQSWNNEEIYS